MMMNRHFLTLSTPDLLSLAIGVEISNAKRYREWADRFRPFNGAVSNLFDEMADHSDRHGDELRSSQGEQFGEVSRAADSREIDAHSENASGVGDHFFVISNGMAHRILTSALHTLSKARYFYKTLLVTTRNALLRKTYEPRTVPDRGHIEQLNRFLERY
jgi:rubrerythrin